MFFINKILESKEKMKISIVFLKISVVWHDFFSISFKILVKIFQNDRFWRKNFVLRAGCCRGARRTKGVARKGSRPLLKGGVKTLSPFRPNGFGKQNMGGEGVGTNYFENQKCSKLSFMETQKNLNNQLVYFQPFQSKRS